MHARTVPLETYLHGAWKFKRAFSYVFNVARAYSRNRNVGERGINDLVFTNPFLSWQYTLGKSGGPSLAETKKTGFKIFHRIVSFFFLLVIAITLFEIILILSGFPEIHLFINPTTTFLVSGILSCFCTFYFTRSELEKERNGQLGTA